MNNKRQREAEELCVNLLGFMPSENEMEALFKHNPGAAMLLLSVIDKNYFYRHWKISKY